MEQVEALAAHEEEEEEISSSARNTNNHEYAVDPAVLQLLLKLPKGKVLLARVLELALLPPVIVQVLLPVALQVLTATPAVTAEGGATTAGMVVADDRVFAAWTMVIQTLPDLSGSTIRQTVQAVQQQSEAALSSNLRMQCTHALLQRGGIVAAQRTSLEAVCNEDRRRLR
jgi:hypothetical protein